VIFDSVKVPEQQLACNTQRRAPAVPSSHLERYLR
jgi:hypothetical protein